MNFEAYVSIHAKFWHYVTLYDIWGDTLFYGNLHLHNVIIHRNSSQNQFINECARKNLAKIPEGRKDFFVRRRRI